MKTFVHAVATFLLSSLVSLSALVGYTPQPVQVPLPGPSPVAEHIQLGAAPQFTAARPTFLYGGGITSAATSIKLTSLKTPDGTAITSAQLVGGVGSVFYVTVEPATSKKETVSCTAVTQNSDGTATITGCTRGLQFTYPYTASASLALSHAGGSSVVLSNSPQLYQDIIAYVNSSVASGVNNASTIAKGIVQLGTANQAASHTAIGGGSTDAALALTTNIASSSRTANTAQVVIASSTTGYIDSSYINLTPLIPGFSATSATSTFSTSSLKVGSFPAYQIGKNVLVFTSTGTSTFTVPSGITRVLVRVQGGGGDGGGNAFNNPGASAGGGGGGGGYSEEFVDVTGTSTIQYYVGTKGQWSTFGTNGFYLSATPGVTGTTATNGVGAAGGAPGVGSGGDLNLTGGTGGIGAFTGTALGIGGTGGSSMFAASAPGTTNANGTAAANYGGGGAGSGGSGAGGTFTGGNGSQGLVEIIW